MRTRLAAALDDLMVPPVYSGNVVLNFRTFLIRICSLKYVDKLTRDHLTMDQVEQRTVYSEVDPIIRTTGARPLDSACGSHLTLGAIDLPRRLIV
jgi:hypothetical protein